jgi:hypothetical protein
MIVMKLKFRMLSALLALVLLLPLIPVVSLAADGDEAALNGPWDGSVAEAYAGGTGVASDPYQIANGAQLALMAAHMNSSNSATVEKYKKAMELLLAQNVEFV